MWRYATTSVRIPRWITWLFLMLLTGCNLIAALPDSQIVQDVPVPTPAQLLPDANSVMDGICFASAQDAAGKLFVLRSRGELSHFFDLADNSRLCREPVGRHPFDFSGGRVLAGLWSTGHGCRARHEVLRLSRVNEGDAPRFQLQLRLITEGDCDYELVQPWWIALDDAQNMVIDIQVLP